MLRYLINKTKSVILTLRLSILSIFVTLFVSSILVMMAVSYFHYSQTISYISFQLMREAAKDTFEELQNEIQDITLESEFSADLLSKNILNQKDQESLMQYTYGLMQIESGTLPSVQSVYWGDVTGNFVMSEKTIANTVDSEIISRMQQPETRKLIHRDSRGNIIKVDNSINFPYDPRIRPWYLAAKKAEKLVWTDVFAYRLTGLLGITAAIPVYHNNIFSGVFALNVRLDYLRTFIEKQRVSSHGMAFIVTDTGKVVAFPHLQQDKDPNLLDIKKLPYPWIIESFEQYQKTKKNEFMFHYAGRDYLAVYQPIPHLVSYGWLIGVVAPEKDFIEELIRYNFFTIGASLLILLIGVALMSRLVNRIVNPMKKLVIETEKIRNFELQETGRVKSRIKEVIALSNSIYAMKQGLRSFQKYVPSMLVRQLIESGQDVLSGGEKKNLAIFFSDIQDFTEISEKLDPHKLMEHLCEYLNEMSYVISKNRGTIDKYIGDSIMAFWGAPLPEEYSCQQAAHAALYCLKRLEILNERWRKSGIVPFQTRIGLHYGEAIVGNLGSEERLNYTAIGDVINITSRLEGINKIYGSHILVSQIFYEEIKTQFVLRFLDCVAVKGKTQSMQVYELLAENRIELSFDIDAYQAEFLLGFADYQKQYWDNAIKHFTACLAIYPADTLAHVYITRCETFKSNPPPADWDGVWRVYEK